MKVVLGRGQQLDVEIEDADGKFTISYDVRADGRLVVKADMPGNVKGEEGEIYVEDFRRKDPDFKQAEEDEEEHGEVFEVCVPPADPNADAWPAVEQFSSREEAIGFARAKFGADEEGRVGLVSSFHQ